jgi:hypothetical protein
VGPGTNVGMLLATFFATKIFFFTVEKKHRKGPVPYNVPGKEQHGKK